MKTNILPGKSIGPFNLGLSDKSIIELLKVEGLDFVESKDEISCEKQGLKFFFKDNRLIQITTHKNNYFLLDHLIVGCSLKIIKQEISPYYFDEIECVYMLIKYTGICLDVVDGPDQDQDEDWEDQQIITHVSVF